MQVLIQRAVSFLCRQAPCHKVRGGWMYILSGEFSLFRLIGDLIHAFSLLLTLSGSHENHSRQRSSPCHIFSSSPPMRHQGCSFCDLSYTLTDHSQGQHIKCCLDQWICHWLCLITRFSSLAINSRSAPTLSTLWTCLVQSEASFLRLGRRNESQRTLKIWQWGERLCELASFRVEFWAQETPSLCRTRIKQMPSRSEVQEWEHAPLVTHDEQNSWCYRTQQNGIQAQGSHSAQFSRESL